MSGSDSDGPLEEALRGLSVVVVDDDAETVALVAALLKQCGAMVRHATSSRDALQLLSEGWPDIVLSDLEMPDGDGYHLAAGIRTLGRGAARLPLVALTGLSGSTDRRRAMAAGFSDVLVKPLDLDQLVATLRRLSAPPKEGPRFRRRDAGPAAP